MTDNSLTRIKAWVHWNKLEKELDEDRLLMADDLSKLVAVVETAKECIQFDDYIESFDFSGMRDAIKALDQ